MNKKQWKKLAKEQEALVEAKRTELQKLWAYIEKLHVGNVRDLAREKAMAEFIEKKLPSWISGLKVLQDEMYESLSPQHVLAVDFKNLREMLHYQRWQTESIQKLCSDVLKPTEEPEEG